MTIQIENKSIISVIPEQVSTDVKGEVVILQLKSGKYFGLNALGSRIWNLIQQPTPVHKIHETLLSEYDVTQERIEKDVTKLLQSLLDGGLIEVVNEPNS